MAEHFLEDCQTHQKLRAETWPADIPAWDKLCSLWRSSSVQRHMYQLPEFLSETTPTTEKKHWEKFWETGWSAYGLFLAHRCSFELNWTKEKNHLLIRKIVNKDKYKQTFFIYIYHRLTVALTLQKAIYLKNSHMFCVVIKSAFLLALSDRVCFIFRCKRTSDNAKISRLSLFENLSLHSSTWTISSWPKIRPDITQFAWLGWNHMLTN